MLQLRDYQVDISRKAIEILNKHKIVCLSLEMRTGKTLTSMNIANIYGAKKVLFVTKKKAIGSIKADYELLMPNFEICMINYESIHKINFVPDFVIVDECHSLGSFPKPSNRAKELKLIVKNLPLILMSGTFSPESFSQLYHQFWVSENSPFKMHKNFYDWAKYYVRKKIKYIYNREINDYSNANKQLIDEKTKHLFISFTQKEAGFETKIDEKILYCEMHPQTAYAINKLQKDKILKIGEQVILADTAVKEMNKVHQLSSGSVLDEDGAFIIIDYSKAIFIKEYFKGKKIAIFYLFRGEKKILTDIFTNFTESPEEFQISEDKTFIGQFRSSREGIKLDSAECLIFYNIDFPYLSYAQGKERIISKDKIQQSTLYFIFGKNGIEEKIYKVLKNKTDYTTNYYKGDYVRI